MNVLMTISVIGAGLLGEWSEGALVVVLFSIGTTLQAITFDRTRGRSGRCSTSLRKRRAWCGVGWKPPSPHRRSRLATSCECVRRAAAGRRRVIDGHSDINQAPITGESMPVDRVAGDEVFAGTLNGAGLLDIRVTKPASRSMLASIVHLVEDAQSSRAPSQQLVDRFASIYTPIVVALAGLIVLAGGALTGDWSTWVYRALVLLVIACPCALVISTPVSIVSAIGSASRRGMLFKVARRWKRRVALALSPSTRPARSPSVVPP